MGAGLVGSVAGCLFEPSFDDADVIAGPDNDPIFEPAELTVAAGDSVTWGFASAGHNVSCRPEDSAAVTVPDGAEPFASYGPDDTADRSLVPRGDTYEQTFAVPGEYVYVCIPHVDRGMVGTITVE